MPTTVIQVRHLLRRTGYQATPTLVGELSTLDLPALVEWILNAAAALEVDPVEFSDPGKSDWEKQVAFIQQWYDRMATSSSPLVEKMTLFWHGHFVSSAEKVGHLAWMVSQIRLYRQHAIGDFKVLTQAMALEPAMLEYLDNSSNTKYGAQQNFARELMELFTMGVGNYTETDVDEVARAWTGHGVDWDLMTYKYREARHDTGLKTIFGTEKRWTGPEVIDTILTRADKRDVVATFISKKLWGFFAHSNPPPAALQAIAAAFSASSLDIKTLLRTMFLRPEFYSDTAKNGMVRNPAEYVTAVLRATQMTAAELHPEWNDDNMGMRLLYPPNVAGWKTNGYFISTSAMAGRGDFAQQVHWALNKAGKHPLVDSTKQTPAALVALMASYLEVSFSPGTTTVLTNFITRTRTGQHKWTEPMLLPLAMLTPEFSVA